MKNSDFEQRATDAEREQVEELQCKLDKLNTILSRQLQHRKNLITHLRRAEIERDAMAKVVEAARKLKAARDERHARVRRLQEMATEARRTGVPGRVDEQPNVFDIGDVTEEICDALADLDAVKS